MIGCLVELSALLLDQGNVVRKGVEHPPTCDQTSVSGCDIPQRTTVHTLGRKDFEKIGSSAINLKLSLERGGAAFLNIYSSEDL